MKVGPDHLLRLSLIALLILCSSVAAGAGHLDYGYDDFGRLKSLNYSDGYTLTSFQYDYDNVGNMYHKTVTAQFAIAESSSNGGTITESLCRMPRGLPRGMNACLAGGL